jgi:hypothetical protein
MLGEKVGTVIAPNRWKEIKVKPNISSVFS